MAKRGAVSAGSAHASLSAPAWVRILQNALGTRCLPGRSSTYASAEAAPVVALAPSSSASSASRFSRSRKMEAHDVSVGSGAAACPIRSRASRTLAYQMRSESVTVSGVGERDSDQDRAEHYQRQDSVDRFNACQVNDEALDQANGEDRQTRQAERPLPDREPCGGH